MSALVHPLAVSTPGFVHASLLAWTSLSVRGCAQQRRPSPCLTWIFVCCLSSKVPSTLSTAVPPCLHMLVFGGSLDGVTILALVFVQRVILATHFLACSVMLLKGIWPTAYLRVLLSRTSVSSGVVGSLFLRMLLLSGLATLGCSTQAPLTTLLPQLSRTSHLSGKCASDFCHCSRSSAFPVRGSPAACCGFNCFHLLPALLPAFPVRGSPATCSGFLFRLLALSTEGWAPGGVGAPRGGGPNPAKVGPKSGGPKISRFFFSLPPEISFFLHSLGGSSR